MDNVHIYDPEQVAASVRQLMDSGSQVYFACTGAGAGVVDMFWQVPGISKTLVDFKFPYRQSAFDAFIGRPWKDSGYSYCGKEAAVALAQAAYFRCQEACNDDEHRGLPLIGVGLTAAAATNRTLKGGTRCFAAVRTNTIIAAFEVRMEQGRLGRRGDGQVCDLVALNMALFGAWLPMVLFPFDLGLSSKDFEGCHMIVTDVINNLSAIGATPAPAIFIGADGTVKPVEAVDFSKSVVFPGSFNPLHFGHDAVADMVRRFTGREAVFEITADNACKNATVEDVVRRAWQFRGRWPVILRTGASLFVDKAKFYPGAHFVCGYDVAEKVFDPFYCRTGESLARNMTYLHEAGVTFYVMDRRGKDGTVMTCDDLPYPNLRPNNMFVRLSTHWDISSTDLRTARK